MSKKTLVFLIFLIYLLLKPITAYAYVDPNSYKCSISEYWDCITDNQCWGGCGRSPTAELLVPICPTGYRCFCEDNDNDGDGVNECGCVECTSGCEDPYGYFDNVGVTCPGPTCAENGYDCLHWGDDGCNQFNPTSYSCIWYDEACCTSTTDDYNCQGTCNYPYKMMDYVYAEIDPDDESTWCPSGWEYTGEAGFDKICVLSDGGGNPISGSVCCVSTEDCPGMCSDTCPPSGYPELNGVSLVHTCDLGICCIENAVVPPPSDPGEPGQVVYKGPVIDSLEKILGPVTKILYYGGLLVGIFFIVLSGYKLMVSQGNPRNTQDAQEQLTAAILGIIFILLSAAILRIIITNIFGGSINI